MRKTTVIFGLLLGLMLTPFLSDLACAGFGFGLPGVIKERVKKLDKVEGTGQVTDNPTIQVTPNSLNFGTVDVGNFKDLTFTVKNIGTGTLSGSASGLAAPFSYVGSISYSLGADQIKTITVRFSPATDGYCSDYAEFSGGGGVNCKIEGTTNNGQGTVQLPKTGQTTSYATGDDGDLERGVAWPSPRFTDNGNGTVTDNLTGLMWTKDANLGGTMNWQNALTYMTTLNVGGYIDWRLPNLKELRSLMDCSQSNPALPNPNPFTTGGV
ncbi:DUF1566 domain-containing protein [bacterium]|nr:DUF1566 domain-containing protein [bacterium]MBU1614471.1 DUF1566 domain-containing protein [bacterium]